MKTLLEQPWSTVSFGMLARKNRQYVRPIIGDIIDFRIEDSLPAHVPKEFVVGRLPDIQEINQIDTYFSSTSNHITIISQNEANKLCAERHIMLPSDKTHEFWEYTGRPWWEFSVVLDENSEYIKAPLAHRKHEPYPEDVDERLDDFEENINRIDVIAPAYLDKIAVNNVVENYIKWLSCDVPHPYQ